METAAPPAVHDASTTATDQIWWRTPLVLVSILAVLAGGWLFRWMSDDGFIYLRVVDQIWAGNGPVFNAGERVEVATGPLWLWILVVARLIPEIPLEWLTVLLGLGLTAIGVGSASLTTQRATGGWRGGLGVLAFACLPFTWHFATSGLETGLSFAWLGVTSVLLLKLSEATTDRRVTALTGFVIGLGPLIRPDFALISGILLLGLLLPVRTAPPNSRWLLLTAALALPTAYQVFRMTYYRAILPNTAIAKEAGLANWSQGIRYLADTLLNPSNLIIVAAALTGLIVHRRRPLTLLGVAGAAYAVAVTRAGGDFMRSRLLLPSLLLLAIAGATSPIWRRRLVPLILALSTLIGLFDAGRYDSGLSPWIHNERSLYPFLSGSSHPITLADFADSNLVALGYEARTRASAGEAFVLDRLGPAPEDLRDSNEAGRFPYVVSTGPIGIVGFSAGSAVRIVDRYSLADPIGARLELEIRERPGHEKPQPEPWLEAAIGVESNSGEAASRVRTCPRVAALLQGITGPLSLDLAWNNLVHAPADTVLRIPRDPVAAVDLFCGDVVQ